MKSSDINSKPMQSTRSRSKSNGHALIPLVPLYLSTVPIFFVLLLPAEVPEAESARRATAKYGIYAMKKARVVVDVVVPVRAGRLA